MLAHLRADCRVLHSLEGRYDGGCTGGRKLVLVGVLLSRKDRNVVFYDNEACLLTARWVILTSEGKPVDGGTVLDW